MTSKELIIETDLIKTKMIFSLICKRSEIEIDSSENIHINNDQELIHYFNQMGGNVTLFHDSVYYRQIITDTIFRIDNDHILKILSGNYFLNYRRSDNYWKVKKIEVNKDTLLIGEIAPSDTLLKYDFVKKNEIRMNDDSIWLREYILSPGKKDLKKMIRSESFDIIEKYIKK